MTQRVFTQALLRRGVEGLRSVTDDGDALLEALEALAYGVQAPLALTAEQATEALRVCGTVSGAARALGVARSTVRARARKAVHP